MAPYTSIMLEYALISLNMISSKAREKEVPQGNIRKPKDGHNQGLSFKNQFSKRAGKTSLVVFLPPVSTNRKGGTLNKSLFILDLEQVIAHFYPRVHFLHIYSSLLTTGSNLIGCHRTTLGLVCVQ